MPYVVNKDGKPLMPCPWVIARLLIKDKKAVVLHKTPFTIKLIHETTSYTQPLTLGVDTGSETPGFGVANEATKEVVYISEVVLRKDVKIRMDRRKGFRRNRRSRKTRYRPARFLNRKNSRKKDRFSPTMISKINSHLKEIKFICSILPITKIKIETGKFDPHALKHPEILLNPILYQQGPNYGYANTKAFVRDRDGYECQNKNCKSGCKALHVHHIVFRTNQGSDEPENLITLCEICHNDFHAEKLNLKLPKGTKKRNLKHATQMNSIRIQLLKRFPDAIETFGYITKENRELSNLPKNHFWDAVMIAFGKPVEDTKMKIDGLLIKRCIADGIYRLRDGKHSQIIVPKGKVHEFKTCDKVKYQGKTYFIKSRQTSGSWDLSDIHGKYVRSVSYKKLKKISSRKSWIMIFRKFD